MIYVTGSLAYDNIMDYPGKFSEQIVPAKIHVLSLSFLVDTLRVGFGGTAGNIAYNLSLFNEKSAVIASLGKDDRPYKLFLKKQQIEDRYIFVDKKDYTAKAFITTDLANNQITGFYPGALKHDRNLHLPKIITKSDFVVIAPTDPIAMDNHLNNCLKNNYPFLFDFGMQLPRLSFKILNKALKEALIIIANDYEMALFRKKLQITRWPWYVKGQIIITTLGEKGCLIETNNKKITVPPAKPEKIIDPTGAGDAFRAGFLVGYLVNKPLLICGRMGNLAAVYAVEKYGTTTHKFSLKQFKKRYKDNYKENLGFNVI